MTDTRKLSLCITTYNRPELTVRSFAQVLDDPRIDEIIILDDHSSPANSDKLLDLLPKSSKIFAFRQPFNKGMSRNKREAIELASNDWCILFDSDNIIGPSYLDALFAIGTCWYSQAILCPSFARPSYDYRKFQGKTINYITIKDYDKWMPVTRRELDCLLNTCNYVVHRQTYLDTWVENKTVGAADTIWHNYNHLKRGGDLAVIINMEYLHDVHSESGWRQDKVNSLARFNEIKRAILEL